MISVQAQALEAAHALERHRPAAAQAVYAPLASWEKYAGQLDACEGGLPRYLELHYFVFVDCLALYLKTGDPTFKDLYIGEMIRLLTWGGDASEEARTARLRTMLRAGASGVLDAVAPGLSPDGRKRLAEELADVERILTAQSKISLQILMIGDCVYRDIISFLTVPLIEDGVSIVPTFLWSKNPAELRNDISMLKDQPFDLVFYSPLTYEYAPDFARTLTVRNAAALPSQIEACVAPALEQAFKTIDLLAELFECPVVVHNSVNVRRHDGSTKERAKNLLTLTTRRRARALANQRLAAHVAARNAATYLHLHILDETRFLTETSDDRLGRTLYNSDEQHPAELGKWLAREYRDIICARAHLIKKKLVVCDLDNTLWEGVIGEGAVTPYNDKQRALRRLKDKGIVLAINSKNDPKNVHWQGCELSAEDFVASQITWDPKAVNMKRIEADLNLKPKDFVFIDDRADERAMIAETFAGLAAYDPLDERTWRLFARWAELVPPSDEDRTQFYKQREARQGFLEAGGQEDPTAMFDQLGLEVSLREAEPRDLPRVAELINRTNQFNTTGARTTLKEVTGWQTSGATRILVTDVRDKFGTMGTVSIAIAHERADRIEIPIFVLSCRVFGYAIEDVIVNALKRLAAKRGVPLTASFKQTSHNAPAAKVYPGNGFTFDGSSWVFPAPDAARGAGNIEDPRWLTVHDLTLTR